LVLHTLRLHRDLHSFPTRRSSDLMNILVIGGGGREHALVWKLKQSPRVEKIWCAPGNGGIARDAECVTIDAGDVAGLVAFAEKRSEEHTSELQSLRHLVCRLLLEK